MNFGKMPMRIGRWEGSEPVEEVHYFLCCSDLVTVTPKLEFAASPNPVREGQTPLLVCTITAVPAAKFSAYPC